jgi:hypothetical protein
MRSRPTPAGSSLAAFAVCGLIAALGCAGAGKSTTGTGGSSGSGSGGTSSTGTAGTTGPGSAGTSGLGGTAGTSASGTAGAGATAGGSGTTGSAGTGGGAAVGGTSAGGTSGAAGTAGTTGSAGAAGTTAIVDAGTDTACQMAQYTFEPKIPTIYILVDRSGSEFTSDTMGIYFTLRSAVLEVVQQLQGEVRFGLGVFTGQAPAGTTCPMVTTVATDLMNYTKIAAAYNGLGRPQFKAETPAAQLIIGTVKPALKADTGVGQKYMLFVTDTETDYCDDGDQLCPIDSVAYAIQDLYASGFGTFLIGLPSDQSSYAMDALKAFANAGVGQPVAPPAQNGTPWTPSAINSQCQGRAGWKSIWTAAGRTGSVPTASYQTPGGSATAYTPDPTNRTALVNAISAVVAGVKSCTFDLTDVGGKSIKVDTTKLGQARVIVEGTDVAQDATNGWSMATQTQLVLNGAACTSWRMPDKKNIEFRFPCGTIIFE